MYCCTWLTVPQVVTFNDEHQSYWRIQANSTYSYSGRGDDAPGGLGGANWVDRDQGPRFLVLGILECHEACFSCSTCTLEFTLKK